MSNYANVELGKKFVSLKEKISYAVGDTASCLYFQTFQMFLMIFYTDTFGISASAVGFMLLITRIWDTANDPIMGIISDRTNTKLGKFRPWILWMILPYAITGVLTFITPDLTLTGKIIYAYITYSLVTMAYTAINIPYGALMGVMSPNSEERTQLSSYRFIGAFSGNLIVQGFLLKMIDLFGKIHTPTGVQEVDKIASSQIGYPLAMGVMAILASALWFITFANTKERIKPPSEENTHITQDLKDLMKNRPWLVLCAMGILTLIWVSLKNASMLYYFKYYVGNEQMAASFMVAGTAVTLIGVWATTYVTRIFGGKKRTYIYLSLANVFFVGIFYIAGPEDTILMYVLHITGSLIAGPLMPLTWSMYADTADYAEWRFNRRATGLVFSAATTAQKFGWVIGGSIAAWTLSSFGYQPNVEQTELARQGIRLMMSVLPAIGCILVAVVSLFYNLSEDFLKQIEAELIERKSQQQSN